eukprot:391489_1
MNISSDISIITERTLEPEFACAANEYIKVRLKCEVLKNSKSLNKLIHILDIYNKIKNPDVKSLQLGGTSSASIDRLMQLKAFDLMRFETAMVIQKKWTEYSVPTLFYDECSQRKDSQMSILMAFNTIVPEEDEYKLPEIFTPKLQAGNIIRAIWHRNIPGKDTKTIMDWAVKPAIDELNEIGKLLYAEHWRCLRGIMEKTLAVMSDQNNGALDIGSHIVVEFKVTLFIQLICVMHNVHNALEKINNRLLYERRLELKRQPQADPVLKNLKNIDIIEICNRIQKSINAKFDGHKNKGITFKVFTSYSEDKDFFTKFRRVVGERKQWELHNVHACLSRRENMSDFSMKTKGSQHLVHNSREIYEYSKSIFLLRESIIMVNIQLMYTDPLMVTCGKNVKQMNKFLPILKKSLLIVRQIIQQKNFALRTLFQLTLLIQHELIQPYILCNNLLTHQQKMNILDCTKENEITDFIDEQNFINPAGFVNRIQTITFSRDITYSDKYFAYLFDIKADELVTLLNQMQGAYYNLFTDLLKRYKAQPHQHIPDSGLTTNDCGESLNATGKYRGKIAVNIHEKTKGAHAVGDINNPWETWDYVLDFEGMEFKRNVILWNRNLGTYRELMYEKKTYEQKYFSQKWKKIRLNIETSNDEHIPTAKANPAKGQEMKGQEMKINCMYYDIDYELWTGWTRYRDGYLAQNLGILISEQRAHFREHLIDLMIRNTNYTRTNIKNWGLETKQLKLYEYCCANLQQ